MTPTILRPPHAATSDEELAQNVRRALIARRHSLGKIAVAADGGTIRLTGSLKSYFLRQSAVFAAQRVAGVQRVIDELDVNTNSLPPHKGPKP